MKIILSILIVFSSLAISCQPRLAPPNKPMTQKTAPIVHPVFAYFSETCAFLRLDNEPENHFIFELKREVTEKDVSAISKIDGVDMAMKCAGRKYQALVYMGALWKDDYKKIFGQICDTLSK